jgi:glycine/D-amino acid oxidase-like deaminating enzyme
MSREGRVGARVNGLSAAFHLAKAGVKRLTRVAAIGPQLERAAAPDEFADVLLGLSTST